MNEEEVKKQIMVLESCTQVNWADIGAESVEQKMDQLYYILYDLRKYTDKIVAELSLSLLSRLAKALQTLWDDQDELISDVQEELEMILYFENISEKIENKRGISWEELLDD